MSPIPRLGLHSRVRGCGAVSSWPLPHPPLSSPPAPPSPFPSASLPPGCLHPQWGWPEGSQGASSPPTPFPTPTPASSLHPRPAASSSSSPLSLGHLEAGRRTIARRMSKMVPIALATHSRAAAGAQGVRQLPEKLILPQRRGLPAQVARQPPPSAPRPTSHARTGNAT